MTKDIQYTQKRLHEIISEAMDFPSAIIDTGGNLKLQSIEEQKYLSALAMFYTLADEGRINEVYDAFRNSFPEYYTEPSQ